MSTAPDLDPGLDLAAQRLDILLQRVSVEDIVLSPRGLAYFESGSWHGPFPSADTRPDALQSFCRQIAEQAASVLGLSNPSVDADIPIDAQTIFRAHVVIPPLTAYGAEITLRRLPAMSRFRLEDFTTDPFQLQQLRQAVREGWSILVSGKTGCGKTSFLTALMAELPRTCRVLVLEDSSELPLPNPLSSKLLARTNRFGFRAGATWDLGHLVFESLRMRPDRLILGECRGREAQAVAAALKTGHAGILTSLHAGSAREALSRFQDLSAGQALPSESLWRLVVQLDQRVDGHRGIRELLCPAEEP